MTAQEIGTVFKIKSYKHDGTLHRKWLENVVLHCTEHVLIGVNDGTMVVEANNKQWQTKERALFYFHKQFWFNVVYIMDDKNPYYYCNISSPFTYRNNVLSYIDYDLDVIIDKNFSYQLLDEEEFELNKQLMDYSETVQRKIKENTMALKRWVENREGPFQAGFIQAWSSRASELYLKD